MTRPALQSGAPLGSFDTRAAPPAEAPAPRYEPGGLLGRGGMGEVRVARDGELHRSVAVKSPRGDVAGAADRLVREARLTAGLEHPNIVPVYECGRGPDGQPYYTMRLLPGRSLATTIRETAAAERVTLVRHVLDAARAVAFAHQRGVLHRDLTPANIMVGPLGETLVADWGLAATLEEARTAPAAGTPGFASPEQLAGRPTDARSDVYGLGGVLYAVLTGEAPPRAPAPPVRSRAPDAPPELAAIADRALQPDPADRYPDAASLAADVLAWFEGRRVDAHAYTVWELARRLLTAWRAPLTVAALGAVAVSVSIGVGWTRTIAERDRARAAETAADSARRVAQHNFARALVSRARAAAAADRRADAEILASNALVIEESPAARGVLAALGGRPRPRLLVSHPLPGCSALDLSPTGDRVACAVDGQLHLLDPATPDRPLASIPASVDEVALTAWGAAYEGNDDTVRTWIPPAAPTLVEDRPMRIRRMRAGTAVALLTSTGVGAVTREGYTHSRPCAPSTEPEATVITPDGVQWLACSDRAVMRIRPGAPPESIAWLPDTLGVPASMDVLGNDVTVGTVDGQIARFDATTGAVRAVLTPGTHAVFDLALAGDALAASLTDGSLYVWVGDAAAPVAALSAPRARLAWADPGRTLVVAGDRYDRWEIPAAVPPHRLPFDAGLSAVAFSPDAGLVAAALGDGTVDVRRRADGAPTARLRWQEQVVKDLAFSLDGRQLAALGAAEAEQPVFDTTTWERVGVHLVGHGRRLAWLGDWLVTAEYEERLHAWRSGIEATVADAPTQLVDLEPTDDGRLAIGLDTQRVVWRLVAASGDPAVEPGSPPTGTRLGSFPGTFVVAPLGDDLLIGTETELLHLDPAGRPLSRVPLAAMPIDVAVSPDGRWIAVGHGDGRVSVLRPDVAEPAAVLEGHGARVSSVAWSGDGDWLLTASWDRSARVWWAGAFDRPAEELRHDVEAAWGRGLDAALDARP